LGRENLKMRLEVTSGFAFVRELLNEAKKKLIAAIPKYGDFDASTDTRNMLHEQLTEQLDMWNYNEFDEEIFPTRKEFQKKMKSLYIVAYTLLREEEEYRKRVGLKPTPRKGGDT